MSIQLIPAYGRKYNTEHEALADWHGGKDFKILGGPYTSIEDLPMLKDQFIEVTLTYFVQEGNVLNKREVAL